MSYKNGNSIGNVVALVTGIAFVVSVLAWWIVDRDKITVYEDSTKWPELVHQTIEQLASFDAGMTVAQFGSKLHADGLLDSAEPEKWSSKFDFLWRIDRDQQEPHYIVVGTFFPSNDNQSPSVSGLKFATVNVIYGSSFYEQTVWSIEYADRQIIPMYDVKIVGRDPTED